MRYVAEDQSLFEPLPTDFDAYLARIAPEPDMWVARWLEITGDLPRLVIADPPRMLGEIGWDMGGFIVNHDTCVYQERVNLLLEAGIIDWLRRKAATGERVSILEIGGGYGGLAYFPKQIVPQVNYVICDLPESLMFSALYLGLVSPVIPHTVRRLAGTTQRVCR